MKKCFTVVLILTVWLLLSFSLQSCCIKSKTLTTTITETKVDTIIRIVKDTTVITKIVPITDTVRIETEVARAESYINPVTGKLTLMLQGKMFNQSVKLSKITTEKKKEIEQKPNFVKLIFGLALVCLIIVTIFILAIKLKL